MDEKIKTIARKMDRVAQKKIISEYMSDLGKKSAAKNKKKGTEYWKDLAKKSVESRRIKREKITDIANFYGYDIANVRKWPKEDIDAEFIRINKGKK